MDLSVIIFIIRSCEDGNLIIETRMFYSSDKGLTGFESTAIITDRELAEIYKPVVFMYSQLRGYILDANFLATKESEVDKRLKSVVIFYSIDL